MGLREVGISDVDWVGGKNASLGEMIQHLSPLGINIPDGFVITVNAYKNFILFNSLDQFIKEKLAEIDFNNIESLQKNRIFRYEARSEMQGFRMILSLEIIECIPYTFESVWAD